MGDVEHLYWDLGNLKPGSTVVVTLRNQANVQLMTSSEYSNYKSGRRYRCIGGRVTRSPFPITVPSNGHWCVAIDLGGHAGEIRASVAVRPPPRGLLSEARVASSNPARDVAVREPRRADVTTSTAFVQVSDLRVSAASACAESPGQCQVRAGQWNVADVAVAQAVSPLGCQLPAGSGAARDRRSGASPSLR